MSHLVLALASAPVLMLGAQLVDASEGGASPAPRCFGATATVVGTNAGEVLHGTSQADVIVALGGNDAVYGLGGNDRICAGRGVDRVYGGRGADRLAGGLDLLHVTDEGTTERIGDTLVGGPGDDRLRPGRDARKADDVAPDVVSWATSSRGVRVDVASGRASGQGYDRFDARGVAVVGSRHADVLLGSAADDRLYGSDGDDRLAGRGGDDVLNSDEAGAQRGGADVVLGGRGADTITAAGGDDHLAGGRGADTVDDIGAGPDVVRGGPGPDRLFDELAGAGVEQIAGGRGTDTLELFSNRINPSGEPASATLDLVTGRLRYAGPSGVSRASVDGVERLGLNTWTTAWTIDGTPGDDDVAAGGSAGTTFRAQAGDDVFSGSAADDIFDGGPGTDRARAMGAGDDTCVSVEQIDQDDCEQVS
jgi:Ca2+-binding RTX toxin-like protein